MDKSKSKIAEYLLFAFLVLLPFGQILRLTINLFGQDIPLQPIDLVSGVFLIFLLITSLEKPSIYQHFKNLFIVMVFSLVFSLTIFKPNQILIGLFYFLRLLSYFSVFIVTWSLVKIKQSDKGLLFNSLTTIATVVAIFGWIQYFAWPDTRSFKVWGWDDHLFRMIGTFLDPGFTAIILVLGSILALVKKNWLIFFLLSFSVLFTYSRASYIALVGAVVLIGILKRKFVKSVIFIFAFSFLIFLLPRPSSEGVKLERLSSVYPRLANYANTIEIVKKYPVFGIGFDNLCALKNQKPNISHSCAGSDSSLLTILATTGIIGFMVFVYLAVRIIQSSGFSDIYGLSIIASIVALFINSFFLNSLFYPWVMGWMSVLFALGIKD